MQQSLKRTVLVQPQALRSDSGVLPASEHSLCPSLLPQQLTRPQCIVHVTDARRRMGFARIRRYGTDPILIQPVLA